MGNWTPEGFVGKMFKLGARYVPPPPDVPSPLLWGTESAVQERLSRGTWSITATRRNLIFDYPFAPDGVVQLFRNYFGPTHVGFLKLDAAAQAEYAAETEKLWSEHNEATGDRTVVSSEYLEVIATRA